MKHLIICREYPPAPGGGVGTYVHNISQLLAQSGETVHIIGQLWEGAEEKVEEKCHGRLIIHRVHFEDWKLSSGRILDSTNKSKEEKGLLESNFYPQCFSWQSGLLAERLVEQEGIDIIEAQEYEAPLYFFQFRRALGLGPKRHPPCIVHLHSPTEFIAQYNDWNISSPAVQTAKRLEDYSIATADALLCPSRYLAHQVEAYYGLAENTVWIIPCPMGDNPMLERNKDTWEHGTICYVGRLEMRKGVIEWIDAAVAVAREYPTAYFEFVGANVLGNAWMEGEEFVESRIPDDLRMRFYFHGQKKRSAIPQVLVGARMAVVPSRWENFPNTCIEAMCSGLPVIASRDGGMAEMIKDGQTGWLASKTGCEGLADALGRALGTPSAKIAEMGRNASLDIRRMCDNKKIVESHLDFRSQIVNQGAKRSLYLPLNLPWAKRPLSDESERRTPKKNSEKGLAIVITCANNGRFLDECLRSIERQTRRPASVVIVDDKSTEELTLKALNKAQQEGWRIIQKRKGDLLPAKNTGIEAILSSEPNLLGFAFLNTEDRLQLGFVAACESVLQHCPEVGIVSCWTHYLWSDGRIWIRPCPSFPYQWLSNDAVPFSAIRTDALREAGYFRSVMSREYDDWDLFNAVMAAGWVAVTIPEILGEHWFIDDSMLQTSLHIYGKMRRELLERFPDLVARDAKDIILLSVCDTTRLLREKHFKIWLQCAIKRMLPYSALWVLKKVKNKMLRNGPAWMSNFIFRVTS